MTFEARPALLRNTGIRTTALLSLHTFLLLDESMSISRGAVCYNCRSISALQMRSVTKPRLSNFEMSHRTRPHVIFSLQHFLFYFVTLEVGR